MKTLVAFGDSFIRGDGIDRSAPSGQDPDEFRERYSIPGQLSAYLGLDCKNFGISGGSLTTTLWEFRRWAQSDDINDSLVIIGLTDDSRHSFWKNPVQGSYWINTKEHRFASSGEDRHTPWGDLVSLYQSLSNGPEEWAARYWISAYFFDSYCAQYHIPLMMFNIFAPTERVSIESIWKPHSELNTEFVSWASVQSDQKDFIDDTHHPTTLGAAWCSQWLLEGIKSCKLA